MRALVTNDDGVGSLGLAVLAAAAAERGMDVTVVAPSFDASGSSASMTAVASDGRVVVDSVEEAAHHPTLAVDGPPAFIVRAAMYGAFGPPPDVVLSGINRGLNTGRAIIHSGTVGAALTAANYGRSGLAISYEAGDGDSWQPDGDIVDQILEWLEHLPAATVLNVNVPASANRRWRGVRSTSLARTGVVQGSVTESTGGSVPVTFTDESETALPGTDSAALAEGYVSVTAVRGVTEDRSFDLGGVVLRGASL